MLAIIGAGGFAGETLQWARDAGMQIAYPHFYVTNEEYLDDSSALVSQMGENDSAVVGIGDPMIRASLADDKWRYAKVIHPTAYIAPTAKVSHGAVICPFAMVSVDCKIGKHYHSNMHSYVGHGTLIGDCVTLSPGVRLSGDCVVGNRVYIGSNAVVREKIHICDDVTIGAGAVVVKDISEPGTYMGIPARKK